MTNQQGAPEALAHELFTAAQLAPGEGISDAVARIAALVEAQQPAPSAAAMGDVGLPDAEDMAHSAVQEALSFGLSHDVIYRWMRHIQDQTVKAMIAAPQPSTTPQADSAPADPDGEAFRTAARLGLTLRFYGGCAQSSMPGTPSAYEVVGGQDRAAAMREAVERAAEVIARGGEPQRLDSLAPQADSAPTSGNWVSADDVNRLVRELDVALNGEAGAAVQASLCDVVAQVRLESSKRGQPLLAPQAGSQPVPVVDREAVIRAAVAAMPHTNPMVADDLLGGFTMHTEADDVIAIFEAGRAARVADTGAAPARQGKWTWVPVEPSTAMLVAGNHGQPGDFSALKVWQDMLGALDRSFDYTRPVDPPSSAAQMPTYGHQCSNVESSRRTAAEEPVFAFRRKGLDDFCTCTEERYAELSAKPNLFETRIFYATPPAQAADSVLEDAALTLRRVGTIKSYTNGSYWRNYRVTWHSDAMAEGTELYAEIPAAKGAPHG